MSPTDLCRVMKERQMQSIDPRSPPSIIATEAMVRQAEVDAAYLAVEAASADPIYQAHLQAKAAEARERAHRLRAAIGTPCFKDGAAPVNLGESESAHEAVGGRG